MNKLESEIVRVVALHHDGMTAVEIAAQMCRDGLIVDPDEVRDALHNLVTVPTLAREVGE